MAAFAVRRLTVGDAQAAARLIRTAFAAYDPPLDPAPSALRETAESIAGHIEKGGVAAVVGDVVIGVLLWEERDGGLYVGRLSVDAAHRRQGVARALIAAAEVHARAEGYPRMHAGVRLVLAGNRALFAAQGFSETRLHAHEGYAQPTWVELEKLLG